MADFFEGYAILKLESKQKQNSVRNQYGINRELITIEENIPTQIINQCHQNSTPQGHQRLTNPVTVQFSYSAKKTNSNLSKGQNELTQIPKKRRKRKNKVNYTNESMFVKVEAEEILQNQTPRNS